jgi:alpha-beta hydrolase superfamily lysophospholipase
MSEVEAQRVSWRFSPRGTVVACTVVPETGSPWLEVRSDSGTVRHGVAGLAPSTQVLPLDSGEIYLCSRVAGVDVANRLTPDGRVEPVLHSTGTRGAMLAVVGPRHDDVLVLVRTAHDSTRLLPTGARLTPFELSGCVVGVAPVGACRALVTRVTAHGIGNVDLVDLARPGLAPTGIRLQPHARVSGSAPDAGLVVVSDRGPAEHTLSLLRSDRLATLPRELLRSDRDLDMVAIAPDGSRLVARTEDGVVTRLVVVDTGTGQSRPLALPPLVVLGRGHLDGSLLRVPVSLPGHPGTLLEVDLDTGRKVLDRGGAAPSPSDITLVRTSSKPPVESLVVGDPRVARHVVVALHGGPVEAWRARHDPLLHALGSAGVAVVAPNVRGSSGYGAHHIRAIVGRWGGPDLDDVVRVVADVRAARGPGLPDPVLLGTSYGAWLAVLAAAELGPDVRGCVALAPFISGARLLADGGPVSVLVRRLGGQDSPDLCDKAAQVRCPVLLVHGAHDDVVPPAHSAALETALRARGRSFVVRHLADDAGHDLHLGSAAPQVLARVLAFVTGATAPVPSRHPEPPALSA